MDQAITRYAVPRLNRHEKVEQTGLINYGKSLFDDQIRFARANCFRNSADSAFRERPDYCALFEIEYGRPLKNDDVKRASEDIETSLRNFLRSDVFEILNEDGSHSVAQRTLRFHFGNLLVSSTPDLIVFSGAKRPFIVDWKVEQPFFKDHWLQLAMYAYSLSRVNPHKDFPIESQAILRDPLNIDLFEFQLLHNRIHRFKITEEDVIDLENYMHATAVRMSRLDYDCSMKPIDPSELPTTFRAGICSYCNFQKICWA